MQQKQGVSTTNTSPMEPPWKQANERDEFFDESLIQFQKYQLIAKLKEREAEIKRLERRTKQVEQKQMETSLMFGRWCNDILPTLQRCTERCSQATSDRQLMEDFKVAIETLSKDMQSGDRRNPMAHDTIGNTASLEKSHREEPLESEIRLLQEELEERRTEQALLTRQVARLRYQLDNMTSSEQMPEPAGVLKQENEETKKDEKSEAAEKDKEETAKEKDLAVRLKEVEELAESRLKELKEALEEKGYLAAQLERMKCERVVYTTEDIKASAIYSSMEATLQNLCLQQIEWERQKQLLEKERDELAKMYEEKYGVQIQKWKRRVSELKQQLDESITASNEAKSQRDQALMHYEAKKLQSEESKIEALQKSIETWETKGRFWEQEKQSLQRQVEEWKAKVKRLEEDILGSNETKDGIAQLRQELEEERQKTDELIGEIESLSNMFRDMEDSNRGLIKQLMEKDEQINKLSAERLKQRQQIISLTEYKKTIQAKAKVDEERIAALESAVQAAKRHGVEIQNVNDRLNEELRSISLELDRIRKISEDQSTKARKEQSEKEEIKRMRDAAMKRLEEVVSEVQHQRFERKRVEEVNRQLEEKCQRLETIHMSGQSELLRDELLQELRKKLYCSVYTNLPKDCVLLRCGHLFSRQCITDLIAQRNRKCPICGDRFGTEDYRPVYF